MNKDRMTRDEKHSQCMREIRATLLVVLACCLWHIGTAFALNGTGLYFLGMPAWFSVSVFGTIIIALAGVRVLLKNVFIDFDYDDETDCSDACNGDCSHCSQSVIKEEDGNE